MNICYFLHFSFLVPLYTFTMGWFSLNLEFSRISIIADFKLASYSGLKCLIENTLILPSFLKAIFCGKKSSWLAVIFLNLLETVSPLSYHFQYCYWEVSCLPLL